MCPAYEMKPGILHAVISAGCFVGIPELATAAGIPAGFWFVYGGAAGAGRGEGGNTYVCKTWKNQLKFGKMTKV